MKTGKCRSIFWKVTLLGIALGFAAGCTTKATPITPQATAPISTPTAVSQPTLAASPMPTVVVVPQGLIRMEAPDSARQVAEALTTAEHSPVDYYGLLEQYQGMSPVEFTPQVPDPQALKLNDRVDFKILANPSIVNRYTNLPARLRYLSDQTAWWVDIKSKVSDDEITNAAKRFEKEVMPLNRLIYGQEAIPGIDNDARVHVLLFDEPETWGGVYGYFTFEDTYPTSVFPNSNMHEMFYLNLGSVSTKNVAFMGELAHEYAHLISWYQDPDEDQWFNEATSELASYFTGAVDASSILGPNNAELFAEHPNIQLTSRPEVSTDPYYSAHYAAEKMFLVYLFEQFGARFIKDLVSNPDPGVIAIKEELGKLPDKPDFDNVYANWLVANFLDMPLVDKGQFGYKEFQPVYPVPIQVTQFEGKPVDDTLPPYGARYYELRSNQPVKVNFTGSTLARLTAADPVSGQYAWYSNRGDQSEFSLAREFDLSGLDKATLNYKAWYELDKNYDYAYVEVSPDGGKTWQILDTAYGSAENPFDRAFGEGYTGVSDGWVSESLDLSPYAGKTLLVRFHVINDYTSNRDGFQVDDIEIPELGYFDGAEDANGGWQAQGFIRSTNFVPANWIVWVIKPGPVIERIDVGAEQSAQFEVGPFGSQFDRATVIISPAAPTTTMESNYELVFQH